MSRLSFAPGCQLSFGFDSRVRRLSSDGMPDSLLACTTWQGAATTLETRRRIFFSMRTGNPAEVTALRKPPYKHAQLAWQSQNSGMHKPPLPLPCISLSKDLPSVTSISAMAAADILLHSILAGHKGKKGHSWLKPWLHTALVSVHLCPRCYAPPCTQGNRVTHICTVPTWEPGACKRTDKVVNMPNCNHKKS